MSNRLFDVYLAVDWSARSMPGPLKPARDSLWIGERLACEFDEEEEQRETYWRTRHACVAYLRTRLLHHLDLGRRVFLGCDFPYGYPAGYAEALGLSGDAPPWRLIWDELSRLSVDHPDNRNNRFQVAALLNARCGESTAGPLWGCPMGTDLPLLAPTCPVYPYPVRHGRTLERLRRVDRLERGMQPAWKLFGRGSAGGQALVGIPVLRQLRDDPAFRDLSLVWPFETGFTSQYFSERGPFLLHAEIWPGLLREQLDPSLALRDQAQVRAVVNWLADLDQRGQLSGLFCPPTDLSSEALKECLAEEGWTLGVLSTAKTQKG